MVWTPCSPLTHALGLKRKKEDVVIGFLALLGIMFHLHLHLPHAFGKAVEEGHGIGGDAFAGGKVMEEDGALSRPFRAK